MALATYLKDVNAFSPRNWTTLSRDNDSVALKSAPVKYEEQM